MAEKYSPLPWRVKDSDGYAVIKDGRGECVTFIDAGPEMADAEFIVRAVNNHAELLAALKATMAYWTDTGFAECDEGCNCIVDICRAAIAKADAL